MRNGQRSGKLWRTTGVTVCALALLAAPAVMAAEKVTNGEFETNGAGWTRWNERGNAAYTYGVSNGSQCPSGGTANCLTVDSSTTGNNFNGGIYQALSLNSGQTYSLSARTRDWGTNANAGWAEVLIGTAAPVNGSDFGGTCAGNASCPGGGCPAGQTLYMKWDTFSCNDWNGTAGCVKACTTFVAPANTSYIVLKNGQTGGNAAKFSWDKVSVQDICVTPATPTAPVVSNVTMTSMDVAINPADSGTNFFAIRVSTPNGTPQWIQTVGGTLGASPVYMTKAAWGTVPLSGLLPGTEYSVLARSATDASGSCASVNGPATVAITVVEPMCVDNRVSNPDFGTGDDWTEWSERGSATVSFTETANCPNGSGGGPCARVTSTGNWNGGIYTTLYLEAGETYTASVVSRDVNTPASKGWAEMLIGTTAPVNNSDYGNGCTAAAADCAGGVGDGCAGDGKLLLKWDTFDCDNWNGDETTACKRTCATFTAPAGTVYLTLKSGQAGDSSVSDVSWDKVQVCGVAGCESDAECSDGLTCTEDVCSPETGLCENPALDCDDSNPCTTDSCSEPSGCSNVANTDPCDDGIACTENDVCSGGSCGGTPNDGLCDDTNECTDDSCNPATGCEVVNNTDPCDDGIACTESDVCSGGSCGGTPNDGLCDDTNDCTDDSCNPATGCEIVNNTDLCDDGDDCTFGDTCAGGVCVGTDIEQACCFLAAPCQDLCPDDCILAGGTPQGPDTTCGTVTCPSTAPVLEGISSVRTHGAAGPLSLALPAAPVASEPRQNGAAPRMVFDFDANIEAVDGSADCGVEVIVTNGTCNSVSIAADKLTVNMTYNKNQCVAVAVTGLRGAGGGAPVLPATGRARTIEGDADDTKSINILDLANIKNKLFQPVNATTLRFDIDCTGSINILDLANTKNNLFAPQPVCP